MQNEKFKKGSRRASQPVALFSLPLEAGFRATDPQVSFFILRIKRDGPHHCCKPLSRVFLAMQCRFPAMDRVPAMSWLFCKSDSADLVRLESRRHSSAKASKRLQHEKPHCVFSFCQQQLMSGLRKLGEIAVQRVLICGWLEGMRMSLLLQELDHGVCCCLLHCVNPGCCI